MATTQERWFEFAPIHLEWLNPIPGLDVKSYVKEMVKTTRELGAQVLAFCVDTGGRIMYDSKFGPKDPHIGQHDLIGLLIAEAHKNNLKFMGAFYGAQGNSYLSKIEHPDWCLLDQKGNKRSWFAFSQLCPNSPFGDYYSQWIGEFLTKYEVDGIYVEGIYIPSGWCYCQYCRNLFYRQYGRELPEVITADDADYHAYRVDSAAAAAARISAVVRKVSPATKLFWCSYFPFDCDVRSIAPYADVVVLERQWGYGEGMVPGAPLVETGLHTRLAIARARRPMSETHHPHKQVDCDYSPRSATHVKLTYWESVAHGATVQSHVQNYFETERSRIADLTECCRNLSALRPLLLASRRLAFAGLVDGITRKGAPVSPELKGIHLALTENHILYDVVAHEQLLEPEKLLKCFQALILPEAMISAEEWEGLEKYAFAGGTVIITGINNHNPELLHLAGVRLLPAGLAKSPSPFGQWYLRFGDDARLRSFQGDVAQIEIDDGVKVLAHVHRFDYSRMHAHHQVIGWYPGDAMSPFMTVKNIGQGRIVYIAGELGASFLESGFADCQQIMARAISLAGAPQPISVDAPGTVEVVAYLNDTRRNLILFLINHSTNQYGHGKVLRFCVPLADIRIKFPRAAGISGATALAGGKVRLATQDQATVVELKTLSEYEVLILKYGAKN